MTTLVALPTKDAVVMGCDSLATVSRPMVDSLQLLQEYFDLDSGALRMGSDGAPILQTGSQILELTTDMPFDHMTHVDKIFSLKPLAMGVMFTGITSIGDRTIKSLIAEFKSSDKAFKQSATNYTVKTVGERLQKHLSRFYEQQFSEWPQQFRPHLELILAGYDKTGPYPGVAMINVGSARVTMQTPRFAPVFGGQSREIQRIVYGIDIDSWIAIEERHEALMRRYAVAVAQANGVKKPNLADADKSLRMFTDEFRIHGMAANWGDFSEQNAIDCVAYFVRIMREAQRFSARMPTVGGEIHVALVDRENGFCFISKREYSHEDHRVPREPVSRA